MDNYVSIVEGDLPEGYFITAEKTHFMSIDVETTGLDFVKDSLKTVQVSVKGLPPLIITKVSTNPKWLLDALCSDIITKIFHYSTFDLKFILNHILPEIKKRIRIYGGLKEIACTKVLAKYLNLSKTSLQFLLEKYLDVKIEKPKDIRCGDWGAEVLSKEQIDYAIKDVVDLYPLLMAMAKIDKFSHELPSVKEANKLFQPLTVLPFLEVEGLYDY